MINDGINSAANNLRKELGLLDNAVEKMTAELENANQKLKEADAQKLVQIRLYAALKGDCFQLEEENTMLRARVASAFDVLGWYADPENYEVTIVGGVPGPGDPPPVIIDGGSLALTELEDEVVDWEEEDYAVDA
jgi:hypothetical protein